MVTQDFSTTKYISEMYYMSVDHKKFSGTEIVYNLKILLHFLNLLQLFTAANNHWRGRPPQRDNWGHRPAIDFRPTATRCTPAPFQRQPLHLPWNYITWLIYNFNSFFVFFFPNFENYDLINQRRLLSKFLFRDKIKSKFSELLVLVLLKHILKN